MQAIIDSIRVSEASNKFSWKLYRQLAYQSDDNLWFSPISIHMAMTMAHAGTAGDTREQLAKSLEHTVPHDKLHPAASLLRELITAKHDKDATPRPEMSIANSIWGQEDHPFTQQFLDTMLHDYQSPIRQTNFLEDPGQAAYDINEWVTLETKGRINTLFPPGSLEPSTKLVLANAVYFKGAWTRPFEKSLTATEDFTNLDGSKTKVAMMFNDQGELPLLRRTRLSGRGHLLRPRTRPHDRHTPQAGKLRPS